MGKFLQKKTYQIWQIAAKTFKKCQNVQMGTNKNGQILFHRFLGEYTSFLTALPPFFDSGDENSKNIG